MRGGGVSFSDRFQREEINGHNTCPTYMYRWILLETPWFKVYLHKFVGDDWTLDLHDHPKRFVSIGLRGRYVEESHAHGIRRYTAPWVRTFPAHHAHRIGMVRLGEVCWTLVIVGPAQREWGFWHDREFIPWEHYVTNRGLAESRKSC